MPDPTPTPPPDDGNPPKAKRSLQDTIIEKYITDAETLIGTAGTEAEIAPLLLARGYDAAEFQAGKDLVQAARETYQGRTEGIGNKLKSTETLNAATVDAREDYAAFREIARGAFPAQSDRVKLSLTGDVPDDFQRFITVAHASYVAAGQEPYKTKMTKRGYDAASLAALIQALSDLTSTDSDQNEAEGSAQGDTAARDAAYAALKEYIKELKATCRGALRKRPDLLAKLGL